MGGGRVRPWKQEAVAERNKWHSVSGEAVVALMGGEGVVGKWASRSAVTKERGGGGRLVANRASDGGRIGKGQQGKGQHDNGKGQHSRQGQHGNGRHDKGRDDDTRSGMARRR